MIHLLNEHGTNIGSFDDYSALTEHINKTELSRLNLLNAMNNALGSPYALDQRKWSFVAYKYSVLKTMYSCTKEPPITEIEKQTFQQQLDLIEIFQGTADNPVQVPVTENTDIGSLKKDFCLAYCKAHHYTLSETSCFSGTEGKVTETWELYWGIVREKFTSCFKGKGA
jgi:hypothetical protein